MYNMFNMYSFSMSRWSENPVHNKSTAPSKPYPRTHSLLSKIIARPSFPTVYFGAETAQPKTHGTNCTCHLFVEISRFLSKPLHLFPLALFTRQPPPPTTHRFPPCAPSSALSSNRSQEPSPLLPRLPLPPLPPLLRLSPANGHPKLSEQVSLPVNGE